MADYPVLFDVDRPQKFERPHVVIRVLVAIVMSILANAIGWIFGLLYLVLPVVAAVFISQKGPQRYLEEDGPRVTQWLRWVLALYSYLAILTDRFPTERPEEIVRYEVRTAGSPTLGSALLRLIYSIPSAFVLALLGIVVVIIWLIAAVMVLIQEDYPDGLYNFQRGIMRWQARLLGYHASLVDQYPPFAVDTEPLAAETGAGPTEPPTASAPSPESPSEPGGEERPPAQ